MSLLVFAGGVPPGGKEPGAGSDSSGTALSGITCSGDDPGVPIICGPTDSQPGEPPCGTGPWLTTFGRV